MDSKFISRYFPFAALSLGIMVIATGAVLARLAQAQGMPSLTLAALRMSIAVLIIVPVTAFHSGRVFGKLNRAQVLLALAAGACLALHFAAWISSLEYTSVASSTALVTTNILWVGLASHAFLGERLARLMIIGMAVSITGSFFIFWSDHSHAGTAPLLGNFLALVGSWCFSAYLLIGRKLRSQMPLIAYLSLVYGISAALMLIVCLMADLQLTGFSNTAYLIALGMALGPQLIGHTAFNWALKHVSASFVAVVTLGEPILSTLYAWILFGETLVFLQAIGFIMLLTGIYLASRAEISTLRSS